jgi:Family of unknown function (DUF5871)
MDTGIVTVREFNPELLKFHEVMKSKRNNGGKIMAITYNGKRFRLQSEEMVVPFDMTSYQDDATSAVTRSLVCSLSGGDANPKVQRFVEVIRQFDEKLLKVVEEGSLDIMGKKMSGVVLQEFFRSTIKPPSDPKYSPLFKVKVAPLAGTASEMPRVFNADRSRATLDDITKGCSVKLIVEIPYVYFVNKNFGASVKLFQACITRPSDRSLNPDNYVFFDDDEMPSTAAGGASTGDVSPALEFVEDDF